MYDLGAYTLPQAPIHITQSRQLDSLLSFIQTDSEARIYYIRHLFMQIEWSDSAKEHALQPFVELLPKLSSLAELSLNDSEQWITANPELGCIICMLPTIRSLHLLAAGHNISELLTCLTYPLTKLHLTLRAEDLETRKHILPALDRLDPRLEELHIFEVDFRQLSTIRRNLRTLTLEGWARIDKVPLLLFFPNLRRLTYISEKNHGVSASDYLENEAAIVPKGWGSDYLHASLATVERLRHVQPVHHLSLRGISSEQVLRLREACICARSSFLELEIDISCLLSRVRNFRRLLDPTTLPKLSRLKLIITLEAGLTEGERITVSCSI